MRLAMELHQRGWQVYRAYIDETIDFVILKTYCESCKAFRVRLEARGSLQGKQEGCGHEPVRCSATRIRLRIS